MPLTNVSPEEFEAAVAASLVAGLPAALAAQTARYAAYDAQRGVTVPLDPPAIEDYYPGGVQVVTKIPTVEVAAPDMQVTNFDISQIGADVTFSLIVRFWNQHPVYDVLHSQRSRFGAAVVGVLLAPGAISDCRVSAIRGAWRTSPERGEHDEIKSGSIIAFTVETVLNRS